MDQSIDLPRRFRIVTTTGSSEEKGEHPWDRFADRAAIIILGPPGAGKTTVFRRAATFDPRGQFVTVRSFLRRPASEFQGKVLYLDALDEVRPDRTARDKIDEIVKQLCELGRPMFRLSCREADWMGSSDLASLQDAAPDHAPLLVLKLEPLNDDEVLVLAKAFGADDPAAFMEAAKEHEVDELLRNPETLRLLVKTINHGGTWPATRTALLEMACDLLVLESNDEHTYEATSQYPKNELLHAAGRIAAVMLLGGLESIPLQPDPHEGPWLGELGVDKDLALAAARRRLFLTPDLGRVAPVHRMAAEHLAARHLASLVIEKHVPCERMVALMTGQDGRPATDLRGLFAAFASSNPTIADQLLDRDPIGVILYGDPASLAVTFKRKLLRSIEQLATRDPYFRVDGINSRPSYFTSRFFGALAAPDLVFDFKTILCDRRRDDHLIATVCDIIEHGTALPALGDMLLKIVRDRTRSDWQRSSALRAFQRACPDRISDMRQLLADLGTGTVVEEGRNLRGQLLECLYPTHLSIDELLEYLVDDERSTYGFYTRFVGDTLVEKTRQNDILRLLDYVSERIRTDTDVERASTFSRLHARLLRRIICQGEVAITGEQIHRWMAPFEYDHHAAFTKRITDEIVTALERNKQLLLDTYAYAILNHPEQLMRGSIFLGFRRRMLGTPIPEGVVRLLLDVAVNQTDEKIAQGLFLTACMLSRETDRADAATEAELENAAARNPDLRQTWHDWLHPTVSDDEREYKKWQSKKAKMDAERKTKREAMRAENFRQLMEVRSEIEAGQAIGALSFLAKLYFGLFYDLREGTPEDRLVGEVGPDLRNVAIRGFVALLGNDKIPDAEEISEAHAESRRYEIGYAVLAGMDIACRAGETGWAEFSERTLKSALCFHHTNTTWERDGNTERQTPRSWVPDLLAQRASLATEAMCTLLRAQLKVGAEHVEGLHEVANEPPYAVIGSQVGVLLAKEFPRSHPTALRNLLTAALRNADTVILKLRIPDMLKEWPEGFVPQRALWTATGMLLNPQIFGHQFEQLVLLEPEVSWPLAEFIKHVCSGPLADAPTVPHYELLIRCFGRSFPPAAFPTGTWAGSGHPWDRAAFVEQLIVRLSAIPNEAATKALGRLVSNQSLRAWDNRLKHELAIQIRRRADATFKRPTPYAVVEVLQNGKPATPNDLSALVICHLSDLQHELRHGGLDGWKGFWNVEGRHSRPTYPRPEEDCRDRLVERLQQRLRSAGVELGTEVRAPAQKRVDITAQSLAGCALPVEIKRQDNKDLWTAPRVQLFDQYMRDAAACGLGIYLVLWFGLDTKITRPAGRAKISLDSSEALRAALQAHIVVEGLEGIEVIVLDLSPDERLRETNRRPNRIQARRSR